MKKFKKNREVNMEILDILAKESENSPHIYIYEEEGRWYAYEHSAFLLNKLFNKEVNIKQFIHHIYELLLDRAEIDLSILRNCCIRSCSDTELVIECAPVST